MGACISSSAPAKADSGNAKAASGSAKSKPFPVIIAFPTCSPFTLAVSPNEKVASIRKRVVAEMERRAANGDDVAVIEGRLITVDGDTGDNVHTQDAMTVREAGLEPEQYLWFQDKIEDQRVQNLLLRSSRLTENTLHNSRGVKQGMALIREEDGEAVAY